MPSCVLHILYKEQYIPSMKNKEYLLAQSECANYQAGYICTGAMLGSHLEQWIDSELSNKICRLKEGKNCDYFDRIVKPIL